MRHRYHRGGRDRLIFSALGALGITPHDLCGVFLTHHHGDHAGVLDSRTGTLLRIRNLIFSHDYEPFGETAFGMDAKHAVFDECLDYLFKADGRNNKL